MKKILSIICLLLVSTTLWAEPIGEQRAREIALEFFSQHSTRSIVGDISLEWAGDVIGENCATGSALNTSLMYIYNRGNNSGYVVVAGDTNLNPIIAYSLDTTLDTDNMAEATEAILEAWCRQVESARKAAKPISGTTMRATTRANDAMLYETALWDQVDPYNREAPIIDGQRSLTGCAATAMSILCYYHRWPEKGVGTTPGYSYQDSYGHTHSIPSNTLGRKYDYDKMLMNYGNGFTNDQGNAVAALMKDMGTSIKMMYHPEGSGAYPIGVVNALFTYFGYAKDMQLLFGAGLSTEEWNDAIRENLRNYGPVFFSGSGDRGGHAFIVDGCDAGDKFHFNFGWSGNGNGYWRIPEIEFYKNQGIITNLRPDRDGTTVYRDNLYLFAWDQYNGIAPKEVTSYATGTSFYCLLGCFANLGAYTFDGEVKLVLCDRNGNWKEELSTHNFTIEPDTYSYPTHDNKITITKPLEEGDRMRIYYKARNYAEWQWARSYDNSAVDEVLVKCSPEDMAEGFYFKYDKSTKELYVGNKNAMKLNIYNDETNELIAWGELEFNTTGKIANMPSGRYRIEASLGSDPYVLIVKL